MVTGLRRAGAVLALLTTSGCAVVSPLIDRDMSKAPNTACVDLTKPADDHACFLAVEEDAAGARKAWAGGQLAPGRTLVAIYRPGEGCTVTPTHVTVTGGASEPGSLTLSVWDAVGRPGHARDIVWQTLFTTRTLALASIASATLNPAGARVRVTAGSFDPANLCYRSY